MHERHADLQREQDERHRADDVEGQAEAARDVEEATDLPGPETAVFCCSSPCAPTPYKIDLLWKMLRALNRPGRARTGGPTAQPAPSQAFAAPITAPLFYEEQSAGQDDQDADYEAVRL